MVTLNDSVAEAKCATVYFNLLNNTRMKSILKQMLNILISYIACV